jgi:hypothetical protein
MANIGDLFKFLGSNEVFNTLCQDTEKTNEQIIESVFQNEELLTNLKNFVQDDAVIKSKLVVLIGQKRKNQNKATAQNTAAKENTNLNEPKEQSTDKIEFKYKPIDASKVVHLNDYAYLEQVDHRIRLVTINDEMYY